MLENKIHNRDIFLDKTDSDIILPDDFIHFKEVFGDALLMIVNEVVKLPHRPDVKYNVLDLDDTIYSRYNQLQMSLLNENRGEEGNKVMKLLLGGYEEFAKANYKPSHAIPEFIEMIKNENSMILTAGRPEFQKFKLENLGTNLTKTDRVVVDHSYQKPAYLLLFIISQLGYIPGEINIYDDRVKYFNKEAPFLSKLLKTDINVNEVILSTEPTNQIGQINQSSYLQQSLIN